MCHPDLAAATWKITLCKFSPLRLLVPDCGTHSTATVPAPVATVQQTPGRLRSWCTKSSHQKLFAVHLSIWILLFTTTVHRYLYIYIYILPYVTINYYVLLLLLLYITRCYNILLDITIYYTILLYITICNYILLYVTIYYYIFLCVTI